MAKKDVIDIVRVTSGTRYKVRPGVVYGVRSHDDGSFDEAVLLKPTAERCADFDNQANAQKKTARKQERLELRLLALEKKYAIAPTSNAAEDLETEIEELEAKIEEIDIMSPDSEWYHVDKLKETLAIIANLPEGFDVKTEEGLDVGVMNRVKSDFLKLVNWTSALQVSS